MVLSSLEGGFGDAPIQSAQAFRKIMNVMAKPGLIEELSFASPPAKLSPAAGTLLLTLCDAQTPIYLAGEYDNSAIKEWIMFHCNAPFSNAENCMFALGSWEGLRPVTQYKIGTAEYPDRSATLIVEVEELSSNGYKLSGPGIKETNQLSLPSLEAFQKNALLFPLGLDFYFSSGDKLAALPRTTKVKSTEEGPSCM